MRASGSKMPAAAKAKKQPASVDVQVGARVRIRRQMLHMSQEKLGNALGLTFQQVQKYEKGANRIGASRLQQIATILQVPISSLFEEGEQPPRSKASGAPDFQYVSDFLRAPEGLTLLKAFINIDDTILRRRIVAMVERLAEGKADHKK
jgi:transcriptional regulator with XRE-family HTH domain